MSIQISFVEFSKVQNEFPNNYSFNITNYKPAIYQSLKKSPTYTLEILKRYGTKDNEIKSGLNYFCTNTLKIAESISNLPIYEKNNVNVTLNQNSHIQPKKINYFEANSLETQIDSIDIGDSKKNFNFKENSYHLNRTYNLNNQFSYKIPIISRLFTKKINVENNNISQNPKKIIIVKNIPELFESPSLKFIIPIEQKNVHNTNLEINPIKQIKTKDQNQNKIYNFNIPENFLVNFNIKEINIQNTFFNDFQENNIPNFPDISDVQNFLNNLCQKVIEVNEKEYNFNCINGEFIELKNFQNEEKKDICFLKKKRNLILDYEQFDNANHNLSDIDDSKLKKKIYPLKKKYKKNNKKISAKNKRINKLNNSKNGNHIIANLNQIQINKINLENFPFYPKLNLEENIRIKFLKGIINKKYSIKLKKKHNLIKDEQNLGNVKNKRFEIVYQNKEKSKQFVLHINQFNILYLILYYYYKIKEGIFLINKLHYSHASFRNIKKTINLVESLIKKCNIIVREISI